MRQNSKHNSGSTFFGQFLNYDFINPGSKTPVLKPSFKGLYHIDYMVLGSSKNPSSTYSGKSIRSGFGIGAPLRTKAGRK